LELKDLETINNVLDKIKLENISLKHENVNLKKQIRVFEERINYQQEELNRILLLNNNMTNLSSLTNDTNITNDTNTTNQTDDSNQTGQTEDKREDNLHDEHEDKQDNNNNTSNIDIPTHHNGLQEPPINNSAYIYTNNISNIDTAIKSIDQAQDIINSIKLESDKKKRIKERIIARKTQTLKRSIKPPTKIVNME
jgi:hypothetical protein